jgi:hypothetical protein
MHGNPPSACVLGACNCYFINVYFVQIKNSDEKVKVMMSKKREKHKQISKCN